MRGLPFLLGMISLLAVIGARPGRAEVRRFELESTAVGTRYSIEVVLPSTPTGTKAAYPVIYCTDWFVLGDYLKSLPALINMGRLTEPFILVGISQQGDMNTWATGRTKDLTPSRPTDDYSVKNTYAPAIDLAGGAQQFTTFLRSELIPRIDSLYPSDPARRGLAGYSLGGLLAAYVLTTDLSFFQYYLLGSPSMWWDEYRLAFEFKSIPAERLESVRRIYMSVGAEESWEMLKGFGILRDALQEDGFKEPRARMEIIADAGHVGALPIAMYNGLRFLFRREQRLTVFGEHSLRRAARLCRLG